MSITMKSIEHGIFQGPLKVAEELRALAWEVFTIWECRTHLPELLADLLERYFGELQNKSDGT